MDDDEQAWAQPRHRGRPLVLTIVAVSTVITVLLLLPMSDAPRRWVVLGLLVVLVALQLLLGVRAWRDGRRPLSPRWMRVASTAGFFWGAFTAGTYSLPILHHSSALESAASGAGAPCSSGCSCGSPTPAGPRAPPHRPRRPTAPSADRPRRVVARPAGLGQGRCRPENG